MYVQTQHRYESQKILLEQVSKLERKNYVEIDSQG